LQDSSRVSENILFRCENQLIRCRRISPTIDLILLSHGDLAHVGLYPYAYSRWNLKAPAYTTLPVQAMGRIAVTEDVEGIREEEDVGDEKVRKQEQIDSTTQLHEGSRSPSPEGDVPKGKYVATLTEVQDAFDSVNTLRYSQPTHLQGTSFTSSMFINASKLFSFRKMSRINNYAV
jgi:cleavage and polyadenylation specificity factor subunit 2